MKLFLFWRRDHGHHIRHSCQGLWLDASSGVIGLRAAAIAFSFRPPQVADELAAPALA